MISSLREARNPLPVLGLSLAASLCVKQLYEEGCVTTNDLKHVFIDYTYERDSKDGHP
jgi:hypothetical protein